MDNLETTTEHDTDTHRPPPETKGRKADKADKESEKAELKATADRLRKIVSDESLALKQVLEHFGTDGAFTIKITRKEPEFVKDANGKAVPTRGFLETVDRAIDETWLQSKYGGGIYELYFRLRNGGYAGHRTVAVAGEPNLGELPRSVPGSAVQAASQASNGESPSVVNKALEMAGEIARQANEERRQAQQGGGDSAVVALLRDELRAVRDQAAEDRRSLMEEIRSLRTAAATPPQPSPEQGFTTKLLDKMVDGESARMQAHRDRIDSEMRQLQQSHQDDIKRLNDRHEREIDRLQRDQQRQIDLLTTTQKTELATAKSSYEVQLAAAKTSFDTSKDILQAEKRRMEKELDDLRAEVKELRAKKDKSILDTVKEIDAIKDVIGGGDDDSERSAVDKLVEGIASPEGMAALSAIFNKGQPPQQQAAPPPPRKPRVARNKTTGEPFVVSADGRTITPVHKPPPPPEQGQLPQLDQGTVDLVVGYLERAFSAGTDPEIVAQSGRAQVPDDVLKAIRDLGGVDAFLSKVAKLPASSPLMSSQTGRNWVRKVGKALVGE